jgi:DNA topoisomerase-2
MEKGVITSYDDNSSETIEYVLKFRRSILKDLIAKNKLERVLRLNTQETENLTTIDENGELKIFNKAEEIVKHFVEVRLGWYQTRKDYLIDKTEKQLSLVTNKARFINDIIKGKLKINNVPKDKIITYLETNSYDTVHGSYDYLLSMAIHSLTKERYEKLLLEKEGCIIALKMLQKIDPKEMYLTDLKKLKAAIK